MRLFIIKTIFSITILSINFVELKAQNKTDQIAVKKFVNYYNQDKPDSLFQLFDSSMKKALPLDKTSEFIKGTKQQLGMIEEYSFTEYNKQNKQVAVYKAQFENATLNLNIVTDNDGHISGLFLKPYVKETNTKIVNVLENIPNTISEIIYENIKMFSEKNQLSVAIIKNGKVSYYGVIIENDSLKSVENKDKIFEIGSVTKVFTSTVLANLAVNNKIQLEKNINSYFDFSFKADKKISFLDLANHTSGLPRLPSNLDLTKVNPNNPYQEYNEKMLKEYLKNALHLSNLEIKEYEYSNLGVGLLLYSLSLSQNQSFEALLQKNIFDKYQMTNTYTNRLNLKNKLIKSYDENENELENWDFGVLFGAGGILSSVSDLSKFVLAHFSPLNKELSLTRKATFTINDNMKIGLGLHIIKLDKDHEVYWHNGGTGGYSSSLVFDTKKKNGVIILSNLSAFSPYNKNIDQLCFELIKQLN